MITGYMWFLFGLGILLWCTFFGDPGPPSFPFGFSIMALGLCVVLDARLRKLEKK